MSSRVLISMLCVGAVAFACGPRAHNEVAATSKKSTATVAQAASKPPEGQQQRSTRAVSKEQKWPVAAEIAILREDATIRIALRVVNVSKKRVEITFPSGQTYDFAVLDSTGQEMWRWGSDRMFTQALRNKLLTAGESLDFDEPLRSVLPPGRYTARATLKSANYPLVEETEFTIFATTIASR